MALLKFLKGNYSNLSGATISEGQILICNDTAEMFVDVASDKRIKIGDFTVVASIAALEALDATAVPTSRLYYVEDGNILARSNGTTWVQVNKQKTADELKTMLGLGSLAYLSEVSEDNLNSALKEKVNAAAEGNHSHANKTVLDSISADQIAVWDAAEGNAKSYADTELAKKVDKAEGYSLVADTEIARLAEVDNYDDTALAGRVTTAEGKITALETASGTHAVKTEVEAELAKKVDKVEGKSLIADTEIERLKNVTNYNDTEVRNLITDNTNAIAEINSADTGLLKQAKDYADGKDGAIAEAKKAGTDAAATAETAQQTADAKVASVTAGDASVTVGGTTTAPTVAAKLSADADNALTLAEDGLKVVIPAAAEYSIVKAADSGDYAAVYNLTKDGTIVGASINIPKDMVVKSGSVVGDEIVLVLNDADSTEIKIPVGSLIEYVTSGSATGDMVVVNVSDDHKVTAVITDGTITLAKLTTEVQTAIGKAHTHENATVLDSISADQIAAWDGSLQNAKNYADGKVDELAKGAVATNTADIAKNAAAITSGDEATLNSAKSYCDGLLEWGSF